jgi:hypothetical protein
MEQMSLGKSWEADGGSIDVSKELDEVFVVIK